MSETVLFFKMFDIKIAPILLYGSEVCRLDYIYEIEKNYLYACKRFMLALLIGHVMQLSLEILEYIKC
jgi:hypothetical protein